MRLVLVDQSFIFVAKKAIKLLFGRGTEVVSESALSQERWQSSVWECVNTGELTPVLCLFCSLARALKGLTSR